MRRKVPMIVFGEVGLFGMTRMRGWGWDGNTADQFGEDVFG